MRQSGKHTYIATLVVIIHAGCLAHTAKSLQAQLSESERAGSHQSNRTGWPGVTEPSESSPRLMLLVADAVREEEEGRPLRRCWLARGAEMALRAPGQVGCQAGLAPH